LKAPRFLVRGIDERAALHLDISVRPEQMQTFSLHEQSSHKKNLLVCARGQDLIVTCSSVTVRSSAPARSMRRRDDSSSERGFSSAGCISLRKYGDRLNAMRCGKKMQKGKEIGRRPREELGFRALFTALQIFTTEMWFVF
jgi:hypothetical protein